MKVLVVMAVGLEERCGGGIGGGGDGDRSGVSSGSGGVRGGGDGGVGGGGGWWGSVVFGKYSPHLLELSFFGRHLPGWSPVITRGMVVPQLRSILNASHKFASKG